MDELFITPEEKLILEDSVLSLSQKFDRMILQRPHAEREHTVTLITAFFHKLRVLEVYPELTRFFEIIEQTSLENARKKDILEQVSMVRRELSEEGSSILSDAAFLILCTGYLDTIGLYQVLERQGMSVM